MWHSALPWLALTVAVLEGVPVDVGRTTTVVARPDLGRPLEGCGGAGGEAYALGVGKDREGRWNEAASYYRTAYVEWTQEWEATRAPAVEAARHKALMEQQRSLVLGSLLQARDPSGGATSFGLALERARGFRLKMMAVRAFTGAVDAALFRRTADAFREALRLAAAQRNPPLVEVRLLLGATLAAAGDRDAARLELAHVAETERDDPLNALAMATYRAAVGDLDDAVERLDVALRRMDTGTAREVWARNDWDRLRGRPRFEHLFQRA